jgi:O-antigen/teichoic acid export membrane protein
MLVSAVYLGTGLIGLAAAGVMLILCTGLCFLLLVRRQVPWFGIERPSRNQVSALARMSLWIALGDGISKLLLASDVLVLGMVVSPSVVTTYVLTGYASLLAVNLHALAADSVIPGLAGIIGRQSYARAASIRRELLALTVVFIGAAGSAVLLGNRSFVHLWVGGENYAGVSTNFLLVVIAVQTAFIRCDAYILDAALQPGWRVRVSTLAALLALGLSVLLTRYWGMVGLCLGILAGRAIQSVWYPLLVSRYLRNTPGLSSRWLTRPLGSMLLLFSIAGYAGEHLRLANWAAFTSAMLLTAGLAAAVMLGLGLPAELRSLVKTRGLELQARLTRDPRTGGAP